MHQPDLVLAPIQLLDYDVVEQMLQVHPDADYDTDPDHVALGIGVTLEHAERGTVILTLGVGINEPGHKAPDTPVNAHYRGRFAIRGVFAWVGDDEFEADLRLRLIAVNGLSALYGIARVYVRQLSEPMEGPALILPMLSFANAVDPLLPPANSANEDSEPE